MRKFLFAYHFDNAEWGFTLVARDASEQKMALIDELPPDVRALVESTMKLLELYMPGITKIEMLVGRNIKATLEIEGGPITREVIEDTMAHLAFYKRYFPKTGENDGTLDSPDKILNVLAVRWEEHRAALQSDVH